jgi:hypothetical protein
MRAFVVVVIQPFIQIGLQILDGLIDLFAELLSSLVFEACRSCGDLVGFCGFNSVFERDACDDFGQVIKAA